MCSRSRSRSRSREEARVDEKETVPLPPWLLGEMSGWRDEVNPAHTVFQAREVAVEMEGVSTLFVVNVERTRSAPSSPPSRAAILAVAQDKFHTHEYVLTAILGLPLGDIPPLTIAASFSPSAAHSINSATGQNATRLGSELTLPVSVLGVESDEEEYTGGVERSLS